MQMEGTTRQHVCRKNDHDQFIYDMSECTMKAITSHWMSGSTEKTQAGKTKRTLRPVNAWETVAGSRRL